MKDKRRGHLLVMDDDRLPRQALHRDFGHKQKGNLEDQGKTGTTQYART